MKKPQTTFRRYFGKFIFHRNTLLILHGFLMATLLYCYIEDGYEKDIFASLSHYIKQQTAQSTDQEVLLECMHLTHYLGKSREFIFKKEEVNTSLKSSVIHPVTFDLMTTKGACGSYSYILGRLLNEVQIQNRIGQMKVNGLYGGHILLEAKIGSKWIVLDPLYNLYFKRPDGQLASFKDVENNWNYYKNQVPADYDLNYDYEGVRYTNWEKIPVVMPLLKGVSNLVLGKEKTETLSLRTLMLRKFYVLFLVTAGLYSVLLLFTIYRYVKSKKAKPAPALSTINKSKTESESLTLVN